MGVRFYDGKENMTTTTRASCNCNSCNKQTVPSLTTANSENSNTQTTNSMNGDNNFQQTGILREIVGNFKEVRIEDNAHNLRIIGNNNRISISFNVGDLTVIGNNTRLKIMINHGHIKYTGNDGRISLGKDSTEQIVDYSGCNGVLKVQNSKKSSQVNDECKIKKNTKMGNTNNIDCKLNTSNSKNTKEGYASFSSSPSDSEIFKCHMDYSNLFNRNKSMPNLKTKPVFSESVPGTCAHAVPKSTVHNFGNIVIVNSSNICIFPHSYT